MNVSRLHEAEVGCSARICALDDGHEWTTSLRRLGFREGAQVEVLSGQDPVLVRCEGACVALGRCMLRGVSIVHERAVEVCPECSDQPAPPAGQNGILEFARKGLQFLVRGRENR